MPNNAINSDGFFAPVGREKPLVMADVIFLNFLISLQKQSRSKSGFIK